ncbi:hypothetical protein NA56DRAFT_430014 [Hyaloscypha hepaticicola]|uniref:Uncharacterized protein n=1 Tax=Hyaloscypha hepaticicola TaxID=2082293 RepID=A0A2J6QG64_9HELO|nr:hypothetical protein NA56DRAFT_430014 [Hyaloscypha hepaticicola]
MSMNQIRPFFNKCPLAKELEGKQPQYIFYYLYDYDKAVDFQALFPDALQVGVAWLPGWIWHINIKGEQNIRKILYTGDTSQNSLSAGTWGFVYKIPIEYDERLLLTYGADRLRMGQIVMVKNVLHQNNVIRVPVIMYWDPRNTRDGCKFNRYLKSGEDQRRKWDTAITGMKSYGIPTWYINCVENTIRGIEENYSTTGTESPDFSILYKKCDNSLYVNPQQLFYTPPTTTEPTAPIQIQGNRGRIQGQASIGRVEKAIPDSPKAPSKATSASHPRGQVAAGKAERAVAKPGSSSRPKSTSKPAPKSQGQVPIGRAEQAIPRKPTPIGRAEQAIARQSNPSKPQSVPKAQPPAAQPPTAQSIPKAQPPATESVQKAQPPTAQSVPKAQPPAAQSLPKSQAPTAQSLPKPQPPKPQLSRKRNGLGLNLSVKKRKPDSDDDGGQPAKKPMLKKPLPGPSNLRHGTPA